MILILTDKDEPTTDLVIDWLNFYNKKFIRVSVEEVIEIREFYFSNNTFEACFDIRYKNKIITIDSKEIKSYWYRRSAFNVHLKHIKSENIKIDKVINRLISDEYKDVTSLFHLVLNGKKHLNTYKDIELVKFSQIVYAKLVGLKVPNSIITNNRSKLIDSFIKDNIKIVTKSISDTSAFYSFNYHWFTNQVDIDKCANEFSLSLFQKLIDKEFELRIFFIENEFWCSAVLSQLNERTKIDVKNFDVENPNRVVPYKLPIEIKNKLIELMKKLRLNSGSIDMIVDKNGQYYFLEVNPVGQFEQVAIPCNFNIFKKIAEFL